jgi:nicotinate phosphoribosyltransferase
MNTECENNILSENYTLLCDFYELTMGNGYFLNGYKDRITYFDVFFRQVPDNGGFAIACGLEQIVEYIKNLKFTGKDIEFQVQKSVR